MKETARVIENIDNKARVKIIRQSACSKCEKDCMLAGDSHEMDEMEVVVDNPVSAEKGTMVSLEMGEKPLVYASLIIYLLPLIGLFIGYFAGSWLAQTLDFKLIELTGISGSILFLIFSFVIIRLLDARLRFEKRFHPKITGIVGKNGM